MSSAQVIRLMHRNISRKILAVETNAYVKKPQKCVILPAHYSHHPRGILLKTDYNFAWADVKIVGNALVVHILKLRGYALPYIVKRVYKIDCSTPDDIIYTTINFYILVSHNYDYSAVFKDMSRNEVPLYFSPERIMSNEQFSSSSIARPMGIGGLNSKLRLPSAVKRTQNLNENKDEISSLENIEPPPYKKVNFDSEASRMTFEDNKACQFKEKIVAVVKPAINENAKMIDTAKNKNLNVNKAKNLKRRSIGILNKKPATVASNIQKHALPGRPVTIAKPKPPIVPQIRSSRTNNSVPSRAGGVVSLRISDKDLSSRSSNGRTSNSSSSGTIPKPAAKKSRPGWDLKGRLTDLEEAMQNQYSENVSLRSAVEILQKQKVSLESVAQEKTQISQETKHELEQAVSQLRLKTTELEKAQEMIRKLQREVSDLKMDVDNYRIKTEQLSGSVATLTASKLSAELQLNSTKATLNEKQQMYDQLFDQFTTLTGEKNRVDQELDDKDHKLREAEMSRRKLHNTIQELKGNIRVFCRVRPYLPNEAKYLTFDNNCPPHICFPDCDNSVIEICNLNDTNTSISAGSKRDTKHSFTFDRVFDPKNTQRDVFGEISQLIQSAIDGYNVCIFAYGQTGSGKTYTMQGPEDEIFDSHRHSENAGMIPLSVKQIFECAQELKSKGWNYQFEASFLEIYNEKIRDLLCEQSNEDQNLEIKFVSAPTGGQKTPPEIFVAGCNIVKVENVDDVQNLIGLAVEKRAKAATKCNSRSSRSHSVFRLRIKGRNNMTGVDCDGTLTLVDLAGSERLKESESTGERLKEAQSINKSLSTLGQVITSLSQKESHIPYRNSKLTYLLQTYLGGNSKMLMFVNISPLEESMQETINSLRFASKVNQCHIGTAHKK